MHDMGLIEKARGLITGTRRRKVFCIGYNKTGTTTLEAVLKKLGYRFPVQAEQEARVVEKLYHGSFDSLKTLCQRYDAFQDLPFSQGVTYAIVDSMFPGSKFILSVRDSSEWFDSLTRFHLGGVLKNAGVQSLDQFNEHSFKNKAVYLHKDYMYNVARRHACSVVDNAVRYDWNLVYDRAHRIDEYERRNRQIIEYFQGRSEQLLVVDLTEEEDTSKIVDFLELPRSCVSRMPHLNSSAEAVVC